MENWFMNRAPDGLPTLRCPSRFRHLSDESFGPVKMLVRHLFARQDGLWVNALNLLDEVIFAFGPRMDGGPSITHHVISTLSARCRRSW
jgi:hypothetical protein